MKRREFTAFGAAALATFVGTGVGPAQAEEVTLRVVASQSQQIVFVEHFLLFVEKVNAKGKGLVQIRFIGGPETMPPAQQADALRQGIVDLLIGPAAYYVGSVPEADALAGSTLNPVQSRAAGGVEALNEYWAQRLNSRILGNFGGGIGFNIYTSKEPLTDPVTGVRLDGQKLRSAPPYIDFFASLGAINAVMPIGEVYTALERGIVEGLAFPAVGVLDFGWDKYVNYRIEPSFWQSEMMFVINLDSWNAMSPEAQTFLQNAASEWEQVSMDYLQDLADKERETLKGRGVTLFELQGAERDAYLSNSADMPWDRLKAAAPESAAKLRPILRPDQN